MDSPEPINLEAVLDRHIRARQAALRAVRGQRKSLTFARATDVVAAVLAGWEVTCTQSESGMLARLGLDPYWPLKHPIKARRQALSADG